MDDRDKTKDELLRELEDLRRKVSRIEAAGPGRTPSTERFTLEALMEHIPIAVIIADADLTVRMVSRYGQDLIGYPRENLENIFYSEHVDRWKILRPDGARPGVDDLPLIRAIKKGEAVKNEELMVECSDGRRVDVLCSSGPIRDGAGKIGGGVVVIRDITERKHNMEELRKLNAELMDALDRVKVLSGMLPICASCKRIKDDKGDWNSMEKYISERSNAEFTHGICPDCAKKLYPEFYRKK